MQIYENEFPDIKGCVVALGFFDGVHLGHRELIKKAVAESAVLSLPTAVYTFSKHPRCVLFPDEDTRLIYSAAEKAEVLEALGVDVLILDDFSAVRNMTPSQFVEELLVARLNARAVICGYNFRFGKGNLGDVDTLRSLLSQYGTRLSVIPPVCAGDLPVSSGRIRELLESGKVDVAALLLERPYSITDKVIHGHRIGHTLGFPTANICLPENSPILPNGVYFTRTRLDDGIYPSVTNVGVRPTVRDGETQAVCETHIIGYDGDLYDKRISVLFYKLHRPEKQFNSLEELSSVLVGDVECAVNYFKKEELQ